MKKTNFKSLLFFILVLAACNNNKEVSPEKKEINVTDSTKNSTSAAENLISFKVNKQLIVSPIFSIIRLNFGAGTSMSLSALMTDTNQHTKSITFNINGAEPAHYLLQSKVKTTTTKGVAYGTYSPGNISPFEISSDSRKRIADQFNFVKGEFAITSIDTISGLLNATFYGTVKNQQGDSLTISDGNVINGKLNPGITKLH